MTAVDERLGAIPGDRSTTFTVWALRVPSRWRSTSMGKRVPMVAGDDGTTHATVDGVAVGQRYGYRLDGGDVLPDPATRVSPMVSSVVPGGPPRRSPAPGRDGTILMATHRGRHSGSTKLVFYELHVGTYTSGGTFACRSSITSITWHRSASMRSNSCRSPSSRVLATGATTASPVRGAEHLRRSGRTDRTGRRRPPCGIAVVLDVVHNHVGPEGNQFGRFGPYFTDDHRTPWGPAINVAGPGSDHVRRFFIDSAVEWIADVGIDVPARRRPCTPSSTRRRRPSSPSCATPCMEPATQGRDAILIAESSANDPALIRPTSAGGQGCDGVWNGRLPPRAPCRADW
ncbi:MAG: hypothetical protein R2710_25550 [Acidimicrobiales bacterium]